MDERFPARSGRRMDDAAPIMGLTYYVDQPGIVHRAPSSAAKPTQDTTTYAMSRTLNPQPRGLSP